MEASRQEYISANTQQAITESQPGPQAAPLHAAVTSAALFPRLALSYLLLSMKKIGKKRSAPTGGLAALAEALAAEPKAKANNLPVLLAALKPGCAEVRAEGAMHAGHACEGARPVAAAACRRRQPACNLTAFPLHDAPSSSAGHPSAAPPAHFLYRQLRPRRFVGFADGRGGHQPGGRVFRMAPPPISNIHSSAATPSGRTRSRCAHTGRQPGVQRVW